MRAFTAIALGFTGAGLYKSQTAAPAAAAAAAAAESGAFSQKEYRSFPLVNAYDESHDTKVLRFALPHADDTAGMPIASCVSLRFVGADGKEIVRPYTPITRANQQGYFEILVKKYKGSKMGAHLHGMRKGDTIDVKGPWLKIAIKPNQFKTIGMIAGGTGITPMYQVARELLAAPKNLTELALIYACRRKEDVLLGNELNELMELHPDKFAPYFVLSKPPSDWMGGVGHVNKEMIKNLMPSPARAAESIVLVCGPPGFMEAVCGDKDFNSSPPAQGELKGLLKELGYSQKQVFKF